MCRYMCVCTILCCVCVACVVVFIVLCMWLGFMCSVCGCFVCGIKHMVVFNVFVYVCVCEFVCENV